jgi:hypothetical protein
MRRFTPRLYHVHPPLVGPLDNWPGCSTAAPISVSTTSRWRRPSRPGARPASSPRPIRTARTRPSATAWRRRGRRGPAGGALRAPAASGSSSTSCCTRSRRRASAPTPRRGTTCPIRGASPRRSAPARSISAPMRGTRISSAGWAASSASSPPARAASASTRPTACRRRRSPMPSSARTGPGSSPMPRISGRRSCRRWRGPGWRPCSAMSRGRGAALFREREAGAGSRLVAAPELPFGRRLASEHADGDIRRRAAIHALKLCAGLGDGILVPMGFEFGARRSIDPRTGSPDEHAKLHNTGSDGSIVEAVRALRTPSSPPSRPSPTGRARRAHRSGRPGSWRCSAPTPPISTRPRAPASCSPTATSATATKVEASACSGWRAAASAPSSRRSAARR